MQCATVGQHLPVVHVSISFVVHRHDVQEHDIRGRGFKPAESYLDCGEHSPTGEQENNTDNAQLTINNILFTTESCDTIKLSV
jgi:hypothetical protein